MSIKKNWLGRQGLQLWETLTEAEQEACYEEGQFEIFNNRFKPQDNETIILLQFCKLVRQQNESAEEWVGRLRIIAVECYYKEINGQLKKQFIHRLNESEMLREIIREVTKSDDIYANI